MQTLLATFFPNTLSEISLTKLAFVWTITRKIIFIQIKNIGSQDTGPLMVDFEINEENRFEINVPHITHNLINIESDQSSNLTADFSSFALASNNFLVDANRMLIHVEGGSREFLPEVCRSEIAGSVMGHGEDLAKTMLRNTRNQTT
ncbi:MAG: hypothetical protein LLF92_01370 [Planctomycetaceae bacterium]|nr:hypothetical protein [Planctomycetaceae bacterium]